MTARIALVTPRYPPAIGGVERHVEALAAGVAARGGRVVVVTTDASGALPPRESIAGVTVRRFRTLPGGDVFYLAPRLAWWLLRHAPRFDLIHAHSYHAPLAVVAALAARIHGVPLVVTPHYHGGGHTRSRRWLHPLYRPFGRWALRQARTVICNSEAECELLQRDFDGRLPTTVILPGVDLDPISAGEPFATDARIVLTGGRLEEYKQVETVVRALASLPADVRVVVFGDGPARASISDAAVRAGVADRVDMLGRVEESELVRWFRTATVFASLSRHEAFGLTVAEAAGAGAAVVASDIPAYRELAHRLGPDRISLIPVDSDPATTASAIIQAAARARVAAPEDGIPTWEEMVRDCLAVYASATDRHALAAEVVS